MNKKVFMTIVTILVIGIIGVGIYLLFQNNSPSQENEIQPEGEIESKDMRQTIVTLYYQNKESKELMPEGRMIDSKDLLTDPYETLIKLLIEGPKSDKLGTVIPKGTRVIKTELKGDMLYLDLSKEFIDNHVGGEDAENKTVYAIVNTLTELNEINSVKILINGRENQAFKDNKINFKNAFIRVGKKEENNMNNANSTSNTVQSTNSINGNNVSNTNQTNKVTTNNQSTNTVNNQTN